MKKMYTTVFSRLSILLFVGSCLLSAAAVAQNQTYYSKFSDPTGHYDVLNANRLNPTTCLAPEVVNRSGFADTSNATYASFTTKTSVPYTCDIYHFIANINWPNGTALLPAGFKAGMRIRVPSGITLDTLRKYVVVNTYNSNNGQLVEGAYNQTIQGIDSAQNGQDWYLYFVTTQPFNTVELNVDPNITPLNNTNFEFDVLYAVAANELVLPATIENFKAAVTGKNVNLSFQSLNETNVDSYRIERSNNGGASYTSVGSLPAKGNSNAALNYGFADNISVDGNYLYRIVIVNQDGTTKATQAISVLISGKGKLLLYPTIIKAGQSVFVKTSETGLITVLLYDAQGRLATQQRINSTGQFTINTVSLSAGMYNVKLITSTGTVLNTKVMVN